MSLDLSPYYSKFVSSLIKLFVMIELIHKIILWIHIPFGTLSLILFWIPVGVKKGSPLHRKTGWYYFICMWVVLATAILMSVTNTIMGHYMAAIYLGYLAIITSCPLWYSYEILNQKKEWSDSYFLIRKIFLTVIVASGLSLFLLGALKFHFKGMGTMMVFFGMIGMVSIKELMMSKAVAMQKETKLKMHIQGTIITGIAAYTAFFAFGGSRILIGVFHLHHQWMMVPWIMPSVLGVIYMRYMKRKYNTN